VASGAAITEILTGLTVGILVGLTGVGGGILLLPILTSVLGVAPIVAVGTDAVVNCVTKIGAGAVHWRRGNVNWRLVLTLGMGSVPGAFMGVAVLVLMRGRLADVNHFLRLAIAVLLIVIPAVSLYAQHSSSLTPLRAAQKHRTIEYGIALIGLCVGVLVGLTSIGSGTVTLMLLLVFYGYAPAVLVGTDVVHGLLLTGVTALLQSHLGNVDFGLAERILIGSIPGGLLGAFIANRVPSNRLKQVLYALLIVFGVRMFWVGIVHGS